MAPSSWVEPASEAVCSPLPVGEFTPLMPTRVQPEWAGPLPPLPALQRMTNRRVVSPASKWESI